LTVHKLSLSPFECQVSVAFDLWGWVEVILRSVTSLHRVQVTAQNLFHFGVLHPKLLPRLTQPRKRSLLRTIINAYRAFHVQPDAVQKLSHFLLGRITLSQLVFSFLIKIRIRGTLIQIPPNINFIHHFQVSGPIHIQTSGWSE